MDKNDILTMKRLLGTLCLMTATLPTLAQTTDNFDPSSMTRWELVYNEKGQGVVTDGKMNVMNLTTEDWTSIFRTSDTATTTDFEIGVSAEPTSLETQIFGLCYNYDRSTGNYDAFVVKNNKASIVFFRDGKAVEWYETTITGKDMKKGIRLAIRTSEGGINFAVNEEIAFTLRYKTINHRGVGLVVGPGNTGMTVKFDDFYLK